MTSGRFDVDDREYPRTWLLLDMLKEGPRLVGQEVVDLSPGAIELRRVARELRGWADEQGHWLSTESRARWVRLDDDHRRDLSFGPRVAYWVERDETERIHDGRPIRHLAVRSRQGQLTPATSAEIGFYFYGKRPVTFGLVGPRRAHGVVGFEWEPLDREDANWLLRREMGEDEE